MYIMVLGTAMIVSAMSLSALMIHRVQRRASDGNSDLIEARLYAQTALRIGMMRIEADPDWRYNRPNGIWEEDTTVGSGTYTLEGHDPSDNDLMDAAEEPLVLTGIGKKGNSVQKMQVTLAPEKRGLSCLEVAMHSGEDVMFRTAVVNCNQIISAADDIVDSGTNTINADVEAVGNVSNSTDFKGAITENVTPRVLPDSTTVFNYYLNKGTPIVINDVPQQTSNITRNPGAEEGDSHWTHSWETGLDCDVEQNATDSHSGTYCMRAYNRNAWNDGLCQYLTEFFREHRQYYVECWAKLDSGSQKIRLVLHAKGTGSSTNIWKTGSYTTVDTNWTKLSKTFSSFSWNGDLERAMLKIESKNGEPLSDFYVDDVVIHETGSDRLIYRQVISPAQNPFGELNDDGIYVIDCQSQKLIIESSRIVGTLVILNQASDSKIRLGPISWHPARPNFPALMVQGDFEIEANNVGLVEAAMYTNLNPPGTPYPTLGEDTDQNDTLPSEIHGLVYVSGNTWYRNHPFIHGVAVHGWAVEGIYDNLDLVYDPIFIRNPPPGFNGPESIKILLNSAKKVTD